MMYSLEGEQMVYTCVNNNHGPVGKISHYTDIHISVELAEELKKNSDAIWEYIKRP
jgi:hypothetical protein